MQQLTTHPAEDALGAPIFAFLPAGPDAARWRRWQSEMQMLLFAHPVTAEREQQGRAAINGIWLSGGGVLATMDAPRIDSLHADAALPRDLARARGCEVATAPLSLGEWSAGSGSKNRSLVWLQAIRANGGEGAIASLGQNWADPLRAALDADSGLELSVVLSGHGRALSFKPGRRSQVARWRDRFAPAALSTVLAASGR